MSVAQREMIGFLAEVGLEAFLPILSERGFITLDSLELLTDADVDDMCDEIENDDDAEVFRQHLEDLQTIGVEEYRKTNSVAAAYEEPNETPKPVRKSTAQPSLPSLPPLPPPPPAARQSVAANPPLPSTTGRVSIATRPSNAPMPQPQMQSQPQQQPRASMSPSGGYSAPVPTPSPVPSSSAPLSPSNPPRMFLTPTSTPADIQSWLESLEFPDYIYSAIEDFSARDLLQLTEEEAMELLGDEDGVTLWEEIQQNVEDFQKWQQTLKEQAAAQRKPSVAPAGRPPSQSISNGPLPQPTGRPSVMPNAAPMAGRLSNAPLPNPAIVGRQSVAGASMPVTRPSVAAPAPVKAAVPQAKSPPARQMDSDDEGNSSDDDPNVVARKSNAGAKDDDDDEDGGMDDWDRDFASSRSPTVARGTSLAKPKTSSAGAGVGKGDSSKSADIAIISKGGLFNRYEVNKRDVQRIFMFYSPDFPPPSIPFQKPAPGDSPFLGCIWWSERGVREQLPDHFIRVDELSDIYVGKEQDVFESPAAQDAIDELSFSLVADHITLNLEVQDRDREAEVSAWLKGLQAILEENGNSVVLAEEDEGPSAADADEKGDDSPIGSEPSSPTYAQDDDGPVKAASPAAAVKSFLSKSMKSISMKASDAIASARASIHAKYGIGSGGGGATNPKRMTVLNAKSSGLQKGSKSIKEGFLWKLGGLRKNWQKRYFKIQLAERALDYYVYDMRAKVPFKRAGSISLMGALVTRVDEAQYHKPHLFAINPPGTSRHFLLQAESDSERDEWMRIIQRFSNMGTGAAGSAVSEAASGMSSLSMAGFDSSNPIQKEGYLMKQGALNRQWQKRKFQFRGGVLEYFKPDSGDLAGSIPVLGSKIVPLQGELFPNSGQSYVFGVTPLNSRRQFVLGANSRDERDEWLGILTSYQSSSTAEKREENSIREGFFYKQSGGLLSQWQERYFVLTRTSLAYYKAKHEKAPAGLIDLSMGGTLNKESFQTIKREFAFSLVPTSSKNSRKYLLACKNDQERNEWMTAISGVLQQLAGKGF